MGRQGEIASGQQVRRWRGEAGSGTPGGNSKWSASKKMERGRLVVGRQGEIASGQQVRRWRGGGLVVGW